jgi:curved DNA-binding protein CbpA
MPHIINLWKQPEIKIPYSRVNENRVLSHLTGKGLDMTFTPKYFSPEMSIEELRKNFRRHCLVLHPDKGGDAEEFKAMKNEYDYFIKLSAAGEAGRAAAKDRKPFYTYESEKALQDAIERFLAIPDIVVEICGSWLWITGNTFPVHERIKALGAKFSRNKKAWYWSPTMSQGKMRGIYSMKKIREKFGSICLESEAEEKLIAA